MRLVPAQSARRHLERRLRARERRRPVALPGAWGFLPGLGFAVLVGFANWAVIYFAHWDMGFALYVGLPMSVGTMLGYTVTVRGALMGLFGGAAAVLAMVLLGAMFEFAGALSTELLTQLLGFAAVSFKARSMQTASGLCALGERIRQL